MKVNDILITAYPRSGITYLGFLLVAARSLLNEMCVFPTFYNIDSFLIDLHRFNGFDPPQEWPDGMGHFLKSHSNREKDIRMQSYCNVIYLLRDPVATIASYYDFSGKPIPINAWLDQAIAGWKAHVESWLRQGPLSQSLMVICYDELIKNPSSVLRHAFNMLGFHVTFENLILAVRRCARSSMQGSESIFRVTNPIYSKSNLVFVGPELRDVNELTDAHRDQIRSECESLYVEFKRFGWYG